MNQAERIAYWQARVDQVEAEGPRAELDSARELLRLACGCPCCGKPERRPGGDAGAVGVFEPGELGYECPHCHVGGDQITWSEWQSHLWCYGCNLDIPTAQCPLRRPGWMTLENFQKFIAELPFKAIVLDGVAPRSSW